MTLWRRKLLKIFKAWSRGESCTALAERPRGTGRAKSLRTFVNMSIFKVGFRTNGNALLISCGSLLCSLKNIFFFKFKRPEVNVTSDRHNSKT